MASLKRIIKKFWGCWKDKFIIIFGFLIVMFLPIILINKVPGKISMLENRYLASFPEMYDASGKYNGNIFQDGLEEWIDDNIGLRDTWVRIHANVLWKLFSISASNQVKVGREGWFFYNNNNNLEIAEGTYPLSEENLYDIDTLQTQITDRLEKMGVKYVVILPPSKISVYPEMYHEELGIIDTPDDMIYDSLIQNTDVNAINLKTVLVDNKNTEQLYFKTDTHWNPKGAYVGFNYIIGELKEMGLLDDSVPDISVRWYDTSHQGEFGKMMGDEDLLGIENMQDLEIDNARAVELTEGDYYESIINEYQNDGYNLEQETLHVFTNDSPEVDQRTVVMFGDSMFAGWNLPQLFAEKYKTFIFVWSHRIDEDFVLNVGADLVLCDCGERFTNSFLNNYETYSKLLYEPMQNPFGSFVSSNYLDAITMGDNVEITYINNGTDTWTRGKQVRLGIFADGRDTGIRAYIKYDAEIKQGDSYTFVISGDNLSRLQDLDSEDISSTLLQEGITYFGEMRKLNY